MVKDLLDTMKLRKEEKKRSAADWLLKRQGKKESESRQGRPKKRKNDDGER